MLNTAFITKHRWQELEHPLIFIHVKKVSDMNSLVRIFELAVEDLRLKQKFFKELEQARTRDKELFKEAKEKNRKQNEEKLKSHALTMKEEMAKEANTNIVGMFAQCTHHPLIPPS
ncbi:hypothetical protein Tco_0505421 [Tanacetum coccineum]